MGRDSVADLIAVGFAGFAIGTDAVGEVLALMLPHKIEGSVT